MANLDVLFLCRLSFYPPLKKRVIKENSAGCGLTVVDTSTATFMQGVYKGWNEDKMVQAVESVLLTLEKQGKCMAFQNRLLWIELMDM